jgi:antitoxin HicB
MPGSTLYAYPAILEKDAAGRFVVSFPDLPEALTDGGTEEEALRQAADCLSEALAGRIDDDEPIPAPSPIARNQYRVAPDQIIAMKGALHAAMRGRGMKVAELARALDIDHKDARRLLDPAEATKAPRLAEALAVLGLGVTVSVFDASKHERLLSSPLARRAATVRPGKAARISKG